KPLPPPTIEAYQDFVLRSRRETGGYPYDAERLSDYIASEAIELFWQHGQGYLLLLPVEFNAQATDSPEADLRLRYSMADEVGDLVWYGGDAANGTQT